MDLEFLQTRIAKTKTVIEAYEDAILALGQGGAQSYTLDTGQTRQTVTKLDLAALNRTLDSLYNRLGIFQARLSGGNTIIASNPW